MGPLRTPLARSMLALVIGFEAFRALFAPLMVLSYRLGSWVGALDPRYSDACRHVFTFAQFNLRRDVLLPVAGTLLPVIVGVALWCIGRPHIPPPQQTNSGVAG